MLDPKLLRHDIETVAKQLKRRGYTLDIATYQNLEAKRHSLQLKTQELQAQRNQTSKMVGQAKAKGEDIKPILAQVADLGDELKQDETALEKVLDELDDFQCHIPNILQDTVPDGQSEEDNVEISTWGTPKTYDFKVLEHVDLGEQRGLIDFKNGAKLAGSRFVVLHGGLAKLQRAIAQFMLDIQTQEHGYDEVYVPFMVKSEMLKGTGQLPKFKEDQFEIAGDWDLTLIPTAEVPVTNLVRDEIIEADKMPLKWVSKTRSLRHPF